VDDRIIDLSLPFKKGMRGVDWTSAAKIASDGYNATNLMLYSHAGTHLDAPSHSLDGTRTVDQLDLQKCMGPALLVDMSHMGEGSLITVEDMQPYAEKITGGTRLLIRTDWDAHAEQSDYRLNFPRISIELARWFAERGIWLLGLETPSVASLEDKEEMKAVHRVMLQSEIVIVESLTNLRLLKRDEVWFVALPLKIEGCDGSPVRAIAIERGTDETL
jgi:kynurenine formamidase